MLSNEQLLDKFEQDMRLSIDGLAESTISAHMAHVKRFLNEVDKPAFDISKSEISAYVLGLQKESGGDMNIDSKQIHLSSIKRFYGFLFDESAERAIADMQYYYDDRGNKREINNPTATLKAVNTSAKAKLMKNPRKEGLTVHDTQILLAYLTDNIKYMEDRNYTDRTFVAHRDYCMILFMLETGLRYSDVASLEVDKIGFNGNRAIVNIVTQKTKKELKFILSEYLTYAIKKYLELHDDRSFVLFCTASGGVLDNKSANKMLDKHRKAAGLEKEVTCHTLRHTCGALMYNETKDLAFVKELLGHGSVTTTQRYVYSEDVMEEMAETTARVTDRLVAI